MTIELQLKGDYSPSGVVFTDVVPISSPSDVVGPFSSTKLYYIDVAVLDMTGSGNSFEVPPNGLYVCGLGNNLTRVICSDDSYSLFTSPVANSGNLVINDFGVEITGTNSGVYDLTDSDSTHAMENAALVTSQQTWLRQHGGENPA